MFLFLLKKLLWAFVTLIVASLFIFFALEIVPGDPAQVMLGINATDEAVENLRRQIKKYKDKIQAK